MAQTKVTSGGIAAGAVSSDSITSPIANAKLTGSGALSINGTSVALGGAITGVGTQSFPTVTAVSPTVITNAQTAVTVTGTNFVSIPIVEAINTSGAITTADTVVFVSATSLTVTFTLPVDGTYYIRVENVTDGLAGRSSSAFLNVSDAPAWVTASGTLGTFAGASAIPTQTLTATGATSFAVQSGTLTAGLTLNTGSGSCTITGTQTAHTSAATDTFTVRATDAEGQTADRSFSISYSFVIENSGGFN